MKFLIDANLSPRVAAVLRERGVDSTHVIEIGLMTASDTEIFDRAVDDGFVVVTTDSDFPMLLALRRATNPSVIHLRRVSELTPEQHARSLSPTFRPSPTTSTSARWCLSAPRDWPCDDYRLASGAPRTVPQPGPDLGRGQVAVLRRP